MFAGAECFCMGVVDLALALPFFAPRWLPGAAAYPLLVKSFEYLRLSWGFLKLRV